MQNKFSTPIKRIYLSEMKEEEKNIAIEQLKAYRNGLCQQFDCLTVKDVIEEFPKREITRERSRLYNELLNINQTIVNYE